MIKKINSRLCFLLVIIGFICGSIQAQGLKFYGIKASIEERTSFFVFEEGSSPVFSQYIDLDFELKIQEFGSFGYLLHIVDNQNNTAYSFTYTNIDKLSSAFKFNIEGKANLISMNVVNESIKSKWLPVRLHIDLTTGQSSLSINNITNNSEKKLNISEKFQPLLVFGRRENLVDVTPFAIRNLKISGANNSFRFLLNESTGEAVHDTNGKVRGRVIHPYWLINESFHWKKTVTIPSKSIMGSKFNEKEQCIFFINQDSLFRFRSGSNLLSGEPYANKLPVKLLLGTNYIDESSNKICAYEINNLPAGDITMAVLDIPTRTWKAAGKAFTPVQLHHHNGLLTKDGRYIVFGGFGNKRYSNNFLAYNAATDRWDTLTFKGDRITPRFFSSIASSKKGDVLYIYGGVGNDSGDQTVGHNYYNDLYRVNLVNHTIKKCWGNPSNTKLVSSERMILSDDEKYLYVIRYPEYNEITHLQLHRISVADGTSQLLGDSIPYISKSIASNVSLYYNAALQEFYCVTQEFDDFAHSVNAHVFTLSAPPVDKTAIQFYSAPKSNSLFIIMIILVLVLSAGFILFFYLRKKQRKNKIELSTVQVPVQIKSTIASAHTKTPDITDLPIKETGSTTEFNKIYIYGIFTVYGRTGRDISYMFSNKLKLIFLYILLNSDSEGVSSSLLNSLFWPEKMEKKAKNLKGVTISNLRKALAEIDGVELIYDKGFFRIITTAPCYCDYCHLKVLLDLNSHDSEEMLRILERGQLLECTKQEFFDKYKQQTEDLIFSVLPQELPVLYKKNEHKQVLRICSVMLKLDPLYEPALAYSVYSHCRLNEYEKLFKTYALFAAEYRNSMGQTYPKSLETLIQEAQ